MAPRVAGALLAAGGGRRMGTPKAELVLNGRRLLDRGVDVLSAAGCAPVFAVVRAGTVLDEAGDNLAEASIAVVNRDPARGMRSSLELAVEAAETGAVDALAVLLVDTPGVGADAVRTTVAAWRPGRIAIAGYGARRGHPIVMAPAVWRAALAVAGADEGARTYLRAHDEAVHVVPVGDPLDAEDLDTPEDLRRWIERRPRDERRPTHPRSQ